MIIRKELEKSFVYNVVESFVLRNLENIEELKEFKKYYEIVDKVELEEELEFVNNDSLLVYSYDVVESMCSDEELDICYMIMIIERERLLYLLLDSNYKVVKEFIIEDDLLNSIMYE